MYYLWDVEARPLTQEVHVGTIGKLVGVVLLLMVGLGPGPTLAEETSSRGMYLALGDSLAVGVGATEPGQCGYVGLFGQQYGTGGTVETLTNLGVSGETSFSLIRNGQLEQGLKAIADPRTDVHIVTLDIGGNDLLVLRMMGPCLLDPEGYLCQELVSKAKGGFAMTYPVILSALRSELAQDPGEEQFLVMTLYNPFGGTGSYLEESVDRALLGSDMTIDCAANPYDPSRTGLNDLIWCLGASAGAEVVDLYPLFGDNALYLTHIVSGDIHPNDAGYAIIAEALRESLEARVPPPR